MMLSSLYPRNNFKWKISLENTSYVQREIFTVITACSLSNISLDAYNHPKWEKKNKGYRAHISILFFHFGSAHLYDHAFYMSFKRYGNYWLAKCGFVFFFFFGHLLLCIPQQLLLMFYVTQTAKGLWKKSITTKFWKNYLFVMY